MKRSLGILGLVFSVAMVAAQTDHNASSDSTATTPPLPARIANIPHPRDEKTYAEIKLRQPELYSVKANEELIQDFPDAGLAWACTKADKPRVCRLVEAAKPLRVRLEMEELRLYLPKFQAYVDNIMANDPLVSKLGTSDPKEAWAKLRDMFCDFARQGREPVNAYSQLEGGLFAERETCPK